MCSPVANDPAEIKRRKDKFGYDNYLSAINKDVSKAIEEIAADVKRAIGYTPLYRALTS
ncbi:hypothetical protein BDV59DRAFT_177705 [Aspergillus ambiguus]|uniref:uncharacterized protein n=1 Tax=Aspergillus ambiguus TaxID=176160 RepID=UPI003CCDF251